MNRLIIAVDLMAEKGPRVVAKGIKKAIENGFVEPEQIVAIGTQEAFDLTNPRKLPGINWRLCSEAVPMGTEFSRKAAKKDSSLAVGVWGLKNGEFDAFVSPGETKFMVGLGITILGRLRRGLNPAIAVTLPNEKGHTLFLDAGARPEANAKDLVNFGQMGTIYAQKMWQIEKPTVGLLNIGQESTKGNDTLQLAHRLLQESTLNFIGNIESDNILFAPVNVIVCPGLLGNIALKAAEGGAKFTGKKLGLLLPVIKFIFSKPHPDETGGAVLLGVNGNEIIAHGNSGANDISYAIKAATKEINAGINTAIAATIPDNEEIEDE